MTPPSNLQVRIGVPRPRPDSEAKVRGRTRFAADRGAAPGLLHARPVLSYWAHARIEAIHTDDALAIPGVVAVLTAADLPTVGATDMRMDRPLAQREITWAGQPVALVVAETEAAAVDGVGAVRVEVTPLPVVLDLDAAIDPASPIARADRAASGGGAISMHAAVGGSDTEAADRPGARPESANVIGVHVHRHGNTSAALAASAAVVDGEWRTSWVYQGYLEPHTATVTPQPDGTYDVWTSTQGTFYTRSNLARIFGLPSRAVRVEAAPLGGAFGSKLLIVEPLALGAAIALGRPVRLELSRIEDLAMTNPAPGGRIRVRLGATANGTLTGLEARIDLDAGAYSEWTVESVVAVLIGGPYRWQAWDVEARGVETNRVGTGSYRGPGGPQATFALEGALDDLAGRLGLDPAELRRRNLAGPGDAMIDLEPWPTIGAAPCLEAVESSDLWRQRTSLPAGEGIGLALGVWPGGKAAAAAACRLEPDGTVTVVTGAVDMTGTSASFAVIAAETLGIPVEQVAVVEVSTATAPTAPMSGGSVVTYGIGRAVQRAAEATRERLLRFAAVELEIAESDLEIVDGVVRPVGVPDRGLSVRELAARADDAGSDREPIEGHGATAPPSLAPSVSAHVAHVRVDAETGQVDVLRYLIAQDVGRALNPALIEGQMRGGVAQGIGWALLERLVHDDAGQLVSGSLLDYALPRAVHVPPIDVRIVEVPAPDGPLGAKGIGEAPVCGSAAAIANAVTAATGHRPRELPIRPRAVWRSIRDG